MLSNCGAQHTAELIGLTLPTPSSHSGEQMRAECNIVCNPGHSNFKRKTSPVKIKLRKPTERARACTHTHTQSEGIWPSPLGSGNRNAKLSQSLENARPVEPNKYSVSYVPEASGPGYAHKTILYACMQPAALFGSA
eukprot:scaffold21073_cov32-Prasinocladus_malaysianus.AAC.1